ncbi:MAG: glycosyltransferase family 4 protein [Hyphomicrobiales bacterium]|nr:glycosyltransferase family 4 protein [Hyphomicrobiales bacterium]
MTEKWAKYHEYISRKQVSVGGYKTFIYPWLRFPTSNFFVDKSLISINELCNVNKAAKLVEPEIAGFDLIFSQNNISDSIVANYISKKYNIPHIHTFRGLLTEDIYRSGFIQDIINNATACITPSPTIFNLLKDQHTDVTLLPHGLDNEYYFHGKKDFSKAKIITVARLLGLKNTDLVIQSLKVANDMGLDFEYVIIGEGPEKEKLEGMVCSFGLQEKIKFTGWLDKEAIVEKLFQSNVMIMPSIPETFGRVFVEASAAGCLVVGHKGSGVDGLFTHDESALFCCKQDIEPTIVELVKDIQNLRYGAMASKGFDIAAKLTWENIANKYIDLMYHASTFPLAGQPENDDTNRRNR